MRHFPFSQAAPLKAHCRKYVSVSVIPEIFHRRHINIASFSLISGSSIDGWAPELLASSLPPLLDETLSGFDPDDPDQLIVSLKVSENYMVRTHSGKDA